MTDAYNVYFNNGLSQFILIVAAVVICLSVVGCLNGSGNFEAALDLKNQDIGEIPLVVLEKSNLRQVWPTVQLPLNQDRILKRIIYNNGSIYAISDRNRLFALDVETGNLLWSRQLPAPLAVCSEVNFYENDLLLVISDTLVQIRHTDGELMEEQKFGFSVTTNAARTALSYYAGGNNRNFYCLDFADGTTNWRNVCQDKPMGQVTIDVNKVYFVTEANMLYVSNTDRRNRLWDHQAFGRLVGVVVDERLCYLPSADTVLYCFEKVMGGLQWKYLAGGILSELPVVTDFGVYQYVEQKSLLCLEKQADSVNGSLRWELDRGRSLLAENSAISYCLTLDNEIAVMDNTTGQAVTRFYVSGVDLFVQNDIDSRIILATEEGQVLVLEPK
ncbi:MAG: PQQ-binding-like beta-propeller repeat protein [Planctomycetes bacterium]|nr:PQQ-binding-like beta-propeller repeat protein [Planctomycetota bacterium]